MILVTGAGGTVGSELVSQLQTANVPFRAAFHTPEKAKKAESQGLETAVLDFANPGTVAPALDGIDRLFLLFGGGTDQTTKEINVVRTAKQRGVRRIVKLSVWGADKEEHAFAKIHGPVEREIKNSGLEYTFLRPNSFMQNFSNYYAGTIRTDGAFYLASGDARISHIDVRDIAAVAVRALTEGGHEQKAYELSGPEALTYYECAERLSQAIGKPVKYVALTAEKFREAASGAGTPPPYVESLLDLDHYYIAGKASRVSPAVRQILGRDPIPFEQYARDHAQYFM